MDLYDLSILPDHQPQLLAALSAKDAPPQYIRVQLIARIVAIHKLNYLLLGHTSALGSPHSSLLLLSPIVYVQCIFGIATRASLVKELKHAEHKPRNSHVDECSKPVRQNFILL